MLPTSAVADARQPKDASVFVPEGLNDRSLAVYCLGKVNKNVPSPSDRMIRGRGLHRSDEAAPEPMRSNRLYETDSFLLPFPGSKLPGYDHSVPPGQGLNLKGHV